MMDRELDDRLDRFERLVGPTITIAATTRLELDALKESLSRHEQLVREGQGRIERALESIDGRVRETNGRLTAAEKALAVADGVRLATAAAVEEQRRTLAMRVAQHGWIRPTGGGGAAALVVAVVTKLLG